MLISLEQFDKYTEKKGLDSSIKNMLINSAESVIENRLGYDPNHKNYSEKYTGNGLSYITLSAQNVVITLIKLNGIDVTDYLVKGYRIYLNVSLNSSDLVDIVYTGGWLISSPPPDEIVNCILQIASLKSSEVNGVISVTSTTWGPEGGNRTYQNTTAFDKFLKDIDHLRVVKW